LIQDTRIIPYSNDANNVNGYRPHTLQLCISKLEAKELYLASMIGRSVLVVGGTLGTEREIQATKLSTSSLHTSSRLPVQS
jgi:hypothetical protein